MTGEGKNQGNGREQSGQLLSELGGIGEAKRIQAREQTNLDKLLELERPFIECYVKGTDEIRSKGSPRSHSGPGYHSAKEWFIFKTLYLEFEKRFGVISFTDADLAEYIDAKCSDREPALSSRELKGRGIYSGFLLNLLTQRREKEGKELVFHIDGKGGRFDYLFALAQNVNELYIENFRGHRICHYLGYKGRIGKLVVRNIKGDETCFRIGFGGNSDKVICANISDDSSPFSGGFANGYFNVLMLSGISGHVLSGLRLSGQNFSGNMMVCDNINAEMLYAQNCLHFNELRLVVLNQITKRQFDDGIDYGNVTYGGFDNLCINTILFSDVPKDLADYLNSKHNSLTPLVYSQQAQEYNIEMAKYRMPEVIVLLTPFREVIVLLTQFREGKKDIRTFMAEFDKIYAAVESRI